MMTGISRPNLHPLIHWKSVARLYTREELVSQRERWRREGMTVVFTNGCYDLLHPGHIRLLEQARSLGDVLILALNSDASVRLSKGPNRPMIPQTDRSTLAAALEAVDAVALFDEETPRELIAAVLPDILVKGADWSHFIAGREEVEAAGGKVVAIPLEPGFSTTNIVERIIDQP
jgi:D-glycero-beta-D-manno-heptose 1-phosphate adenylyltransferase